MKLKKKKVEVERKETNSSDEELKMMSKFGDLRDFFFFFNILKFFILYRSETNILAEIAEIH